MPEIRKQAKKNETEECGHEEAARNFEKGYI